MNRLEGKTAVVTGGSSGIGLATAKLFQEEGARVAISGRDPQTLDAAVKLLGDGVLAVRSDVSKLDDLDRLFETVVNKLGRIDVLFVNAGIAKFAPVTETTEGLFDETFNINVKGAFFTIQKAISHLNDNASIILNTSFVNQAGLPTTSVYAASKAALRSFARTLSAELVSRGIRVNVVSPGPISTPIYGKLGLSKEALEGFAANIGAQVPMKRFGAPEEVANAVLFLASKDSSYITGLKSTSMGESVRYELVQVEAFDMTGMRSFPGEVSRYYETIRARDIESCVAVFAEDGCGRNSRSEPLKTASFYDRGHGRRPEAVIKEVICSRLHSQSLSTANSTRRRPGPRHIPQCPKLPANYPDHTP